MSRLPGFVQPRNRCSVCKWRSRPRSTAERARTRTRAATVKELLIVSAVIALLVATTTVVYFGLTRKARAATCVDNLRQIGSALHLYAADNDDCIPPYFTFDPLPTGEPTALQLGELHPARRWKESLIPYTRNDGVFFCPDDRFARTTSGPPVPNGLIRLHTSYEHALQVKGAFRDAQGGRHWAIGMVADPASVPYCHDSPIGEVRNQQGIYEPVSPHGAVANLMYLDGHVSARPVN